MTTWTHVGNVPVFQITPKPEKIKHYSSMTPVKRLDKLAFVSIEAELSMTLEEFVEDNLIMALLGVMNTAGDIDAMLAPTMERQVKLDGTNAFGENVEIIVPHVFFSCDKVIDFIGDAWGKLDLTGDILLSNGVFFTVHALSSISGAPVTPPNPNNYFIGKGNVYTAPLS